MTDTWRLTRTSEYGADGYTCTACGREGWFEKHPPRCVCQPTAEQLEVALAEEREKVVELEARIRELTEPRGIDEWTEEDGPALWWKLPVVEPPYSGSPLNDDFPDYVTHWTPVALPSTEGGEG